MTTKTHPLTRWLERAPAHTFSAFAIIAAFGTYFSMYAFRKSFAAGEFIGVIDLPFVPVITLKAFYVLSQVLGYCLSKFVGIKVISELNPARRALMILFVIGVAELALLLFALTPAPWSAFWLFCNGVPLGMVWGLVFGFLEGRKLSELLGAGLSASYIIASGVVKSVGRHLMKNHDVSEYWMPFITGLLFTVPLVLCVYLLSKLPAPDAEDEALRTRRQPMSASDRKAFIIEFLPGLSALTILYFFLTAYRTVRDDFAVEIWKGLNMDQPSILATSEMWVGFGVIAILAFFVGIRDNRRAIVSIHWVMISGSAMVGLLTFAKELGWISPVTWMIGIGLGLYLAYVPYGCMLFDRMIAALGVVATAGFMIYVTDAFGYLGYIIILLYKNFAHPDSSILEFFITFSYVTSAICVVSFMISLLYFSRKSADPALKHPDVAS